MVSWAPPAVRVNRRTPRSFSSAARRLETACWVIAEVAAASWNCPSSATATKVRTASKFMPHRHLKQLMVVSSLAQMLFDLNRRLHRCNDDAVHIRRLDEASRLGRQFGWLWAAYAVSAYGSGLGFGAFR